MFMNQPTAVEPSGAQIPRVVARYDAKANVLILR
ncbi:hypothetical protein M2346_002789 [Sphingobium xanthum]|nr:hypothetical protein [Sphingobium sp. B10D3B]MCW2402769.1 hypothetical protein [Sphingobium sp. B10D7B]MCW2409748.1 hypothetical protein [Sphingobium xanthum]